MALSIFVPLGYIAFLSISMSIFSRIYRNRKAAAAMASSTQSWFPEGHPERDIYQTLIMASSGGGPDGSKLDIPDEVLKAALLNRAMADVRRIMRLRDDKAALAVLLQKGSIGDETMHRFSLAERELEAEILDVVNEANTFKEGWGQLIFPTASEMVSHFKHKEVYYGIQQQRAAETQKLKDSGRPIPQPSITLPPLVTPPGTSIQIGPAPGGGPGLPGAPPGMTIRQLPPGAAPGGAAAGPGANGTGGNARVPLGPALPPAMAAAALAAPGSGGAGANTPSAASTPATTPSKSAKKKAAKKAAGQGQKATTVEDDAADTNPSDDGSVMDEEEDKEDKNGDGNIEASRDPMARAVDEAAAAKDRNVASRRPRGDADSHARGDSGKAACCSGHCGGDDDSDVAEVVVRFAERDDAARAVPPSSASSSMLAPPSAASSSVWSPTSSQLDAWDQMMLRGDVAAASFSLRSPSEVPQVVAPSMNALMDDSASPNSFHVASQMFSYFAQVQAEQHAALVGASTLAHGAHGFEDDTDDDYDHDHELTDGENDDAGGEHDRHGHPSQSSAVVPSTPAERRGALLDWLGTSPTLASPNTKGSVGSSPSSPLGREPSTPLSARLFGALLGGGQVPPQQQPNSPPHQRKDQQQQQQQPRRSAQVGPPSGMTEVGPSPRVPALATDAQPTTITTTTTGQAGSAAKRIVGPGPRQALGPGARKRTPRKKKKSASASAASGAGGVAGGSQPGAA